MFYTCTCTSTGTSTGTGVEHVREPVLVLVPVLVRAWRAMPVLHISSYLNHNTLKKTHLSPLPQKSSVPVDLFVRPKPGVASYVKEIALS